MPDNNSKKNKHLTADDRQEIMECLDKGMPFKAIARRLEKDPTTISKEVKKHLTVTETKAPSRKPDGTPLEERRCPLLLKAPFVCNPCEKRRRYCNFQKQMYIAKKAHADYETLLSEAREGIPLNKDEFWEADAIITEGIKNGQRLYHIMETHNGQRLYHIMETHREHWGRFSCPTALIRRLGLLSQPSRRSAIVSEKVSFQSEINTLDVGPFQTMFHRDITSRPIRIPKFFELCFWLRSYSKSHEVTWSFSKGFSNVFGNDRFTM